MRDQPMAPPRLLYLSKSDIVRLGGDRSHLYVEAIRRALILHARGDFVQPLKPYLRTQAQGRHIADRIIAMPAHLGEPAISGLKWVGSKHDNPSVRGMERASALITLNDPVTNYPVAVMEGSLISGMRTAAVTAVAASHLAKNGFRRIALIGCGVIARMQAMSLLEQYEPIDEVFLHDIHREAADRLAAEIREQHPRVAVRVIDGAEEAVRQGEVVVTCTVTDKPYIPYQWLAKGTFVSNISIMDVEKAVFQKADKVVVDDWEQSNREEKVIHQLVLEGRFSRNDLHAELGEIVAGIKSGRESDDEIILLNPMGMAIEDIACAQDIYQKALTEGVGTWLDLY